MCSFNPLSFTFAYHTLHIYGLSLIVKVCALLAAWPPGKCVPLLDLLLCARRNGLPPTPDTLHFSDAVTACTQSPFSFHLGCGYARKKKNTLKRFSSSLNVMVGYLCVQSLPEWAWMFVSVLERQRAILEDGYHHTVVWQRYCRKLTFWACRPRPILR